jgi:DNA-binding NtrC family response regulator
MLNSELANKSPEESPMIVVLEDDQATSQLICLILKKAGFQPIPCYSVQEGNQVLRDIARISAMLIDLSLPDGEGIEVMRHARRIHKDLPCFVLSATDTVQAAVEAIKAGAENYLIKPLEPVTLINALRVAVGFYHGKTTRWTEDLIPSQGMRKWKAPKMAKAMEVAAEAAKSASPVIITGGPCTGKRRFAQLIADNSSLKSKRLTTLNLAPLSPLEIETELFGAPLENLLNSSPFGRGKLAKCRGETLYIENIDCLHPAAQCHLVNFLNDELAAPNTPPACRLITASSIDLKKLVQEKQFRQDLWYALAIYQIEVPSLAERLEDIPQLCENTITRICVNRKLRRPTLTRRALEQLLDHSWPGNLSELYSCLEHAITRSTDGVIGPDDFPSMRRPIESDFRTPFPTGGASIDDITKLTLISALESCGGNRRRAAQRLKISLRTIYNMIERYDLPRKSRNKAKTPKT